MKKPYRTVSDYPPDAEKQLNELYGEGYDVVHMAGHGEYGKCTYLLKHRDALVKV